MPANHSGPFMHFRVHRLKSSSTGGIFLINAYEFQHPHCKGNSYFFVFLHLFYKTSQLNDPCIISSRTFTNNTHEGPHSARGSWRLSRTVILVDLFNQVIKKGFFMNNIRFVPTGIHGYFDYIGGVTLIAAPFIFGFFNMGGIAVILPMVLGVGLILYSLLTNYERAYLH